MSLDNKNYLKLTSAASMLSGSIGRLICFPFDTIKAKMYIQRDRRLAIKSKEILTISNDPLYGSQDNDERWGIEGILQRSLYQCSNDPIIIEKIGSAPAYSLYITSYEWFK